MGLMRKATLGMVGKSDKNKLRAEQAKLARAERKRIEGRSARERVLAAHPELAKHFED